MVSVPGFLLRRLYVKQSLRNIPTGFQFELRNQLGSGYAHKLLPLTLDGEEMPLASTFFVQGGNETAFSDVSKDNTFTLTMNRTIKIWVEGVRLELGPRKVGMGFHVPGLGVLNFDFIEVIKND